MPAYLVCQGYSDEPIGHGSLAGQFLERFDPDAHDGLGQAWWTKDHRKAQVFEDAAAALNEWKRPSVVRPFRPDGQPNRPLTAFHASIAIIARGDDR